MYSQKQTKLKTILNSLKSNWKFYIIYNIVFLIIGLLTGGVIQSVITGLLIQLHAYYVHILGHKLPYFNKIHMLHHTKIINKYWYNQIIELLFNFIFIGGGYLLLFSKYLPQSITYPILAFALIYTFHHLVIYHFISTKTHIEHHKYDCDNLNEVCKSTENWVNYGPDMVDAIFNSKNDNEEYENMLPVNIVAITTLVVIIFIYDLKLI
jgi:hypothetical protein